MYIIKHEIINNFERLKKSTFIKMFWVSDTGNYNLACYVRRSWRKSADYGHTRHRRKVIKTVIRTKKWTARGSNIKPPKPTAAWQIIIARHVISARTRLRTTKTQIALAYHKIYSIKRDYIFLMFLHNFCKRNLVYFVLINYNHEHSLFDSE